MSTNQGVVERGSSDDPTKENFIEDQRVYDSDLTSDSTLYSEGDFDLVYLNKSRVLANAIDEIGFGRYQTGLFFVAGFGWFADNAWPIVTSLIVSRLTETDGVHHPPNRAPYLVLAQNLGLFAGAAFWSFSADIIGRRWAFNLTFLITGVFAVIAGGSPNFVAIGIFASFWSFGVGGNLPVDSAIFLEALPSTHQWLLTAMSAWWALGQLVTNLIAWGLLSNYSCDDPLNCKKADNKGWRYFLFTMGGFTLLMFISRFAFRVFESPRFHLARGDDVKAVETIHRIAKINRKESTLTIDDLTQFDDKLESGKVENRLVKEKLERFKLTHIRLCFGSRKVAFSSGLVIAVWAFAGLAFPLYNAFLPTYLEMHGNNGQELSVHETYRNALIVSVIGIPGAIIAAILVELRLGRKGTLVLSFLLTGVFLFISTTAKTANANLGYNCAFSFFSNIMYGVLYAYTPEIFPTKIRGTGIGLAASANRIFGIFAPIIAIFADLTTSAPIYVSGALFLLCGVLSAFFPYEPRGKKSY